MVWIDVEKLGFVVINYLCVKLLRLKWAELIYFAIDTFLVIYSQELKQGYISRSQNLPNSTIKR